MAEFQTSSCSLSLTLYLGEVDGETTTKTISISSINPEITADVAATVVDAISDVLAYSISTVKQRITNYLVSDE